MAPVRYSATRGALGFTLAALVVAAVALAGCSSSTDTATAGAPNVGEAPQAARGGGNTSASDGSASGQGALIPQSRSVIYTGSMVVVVKDVVRAADAAATTATTAGGLVSADRRNLDGDHAQAELTLRVPTTAFSSTMDQLGHLGTEQSRSVSTQDVTNDLIDLDARLATQRASVDRIRALLAKATSITDIVTIESELAKREADLDSLEQRQAALSGQVALSTITLTLTVAAASPAPAESHTGLLYGLRSGWSAFLVSAKALLTAAGWLAPWLLFFGVPAWLVLHYTRRRRRRSLARVAPPGSAGADEGGGSV